MFLWERVTRKTYLGGCVFAIVTILALPAIYLILLGLGRILEYLGLFQCVKTPYLLCPAQAFVTIMCVFIALVACGSVIIFCTGISKDIREVVDETRAEGYQIV